MQTFGRYEILEELGKGGMAVVYRALDPRFKREVALKVLPRTLLHDDQFRARFEREAQVIAQLEHPAIVPVYDFGEQDGQPYIVMRLMTGGSLAERIQQQGTISLAESTAILTVIAEALDEAHERGIIHRDIKPDNILFDARGKAYLSDFGIAKMLQATVSLTGSQMIIGTPAYMSPEQGRGERDIDRRSDVYALGAILFEMLSGRIPYDADTPTGQIIKHITDPVPNLCALRPDLPPSIQTVIATAMAKDRDARYPTAGHLAEAMSYVTRGLTPPPRSLSQAPQPQPAPQASPLPPAKERLTAPVSTFQWLPWLTVAAILLASLFFFAWGSKKTTPLQTQTPAPTAQQSIIISSPTPTTTHTPAPSSSPEAPTHTPTITPSPTSVPMAEISVRSANVRTGPDTRFTVLASYPNTTRLPVLGVNAQHTWLQVQLPNTNTIGWIALSTVTLDQDVALLPIVEAPPTPSLPPTSTRTPTRKPQRKKSATPQDTSPPPTSKPPPPISYP
ncbi:MAG: serine/threonine protein kinase [Gammaproteobacteria bacterium]|nr:MAG: serine/threonine protein kinase [Gammaproteobacteria bacterium]